MLFPLPLSKEIAAQRGERRRERSFKGQDVPQSLALGSLTYCHPAWVLPRVILWSEGRSGLELGLADTPSVHQVGLLLKAVLPEVPGEASLPHPGKYNWAHKPLYNILTHMQPVQTCV